MLRIFLLVLVDEEEYNMEAAKEINNKVDTIDPCDNDDDLL